MQARLLYNGGGEVHLTAAGNLSAGDVLAPSAVDGYNVGVVAGSSPIKAGDRYVALTKGVFAFDTASATTFSAADRVEWNDSTDKAVASGTFGLGGAVRAKTSGQTETHVNLNEFGDQTGS